MTDWYVKSGSGVAQFQTTHAYSVGDKMVPRRADAGSFVGYARGYVWECTTGGTSAGSDPTWGSPGSYTPDSSTLTSGGAVFTCRNPGYSSGSTANWAFANIYLDYVLNGLWTGIGATDRVLVSNNHNEVVTGSNVLIDFGGTAAAPKRHVLCVDDSATPPTTLATGAIVDYDNIDTLDHFGYVYGITFKASASPGSINSDNATSYVLEKCVLHLNNANSASRIKVTSGNASNVWNDVDVKFGHTSQGLSESNGSSDNSPWFRWSGGSILSGSSAITNLFQGTPTAICELEDLDLSNGDAAMNFCTSSIVGTRLTARRIKMPTSWSGTGISATPATSGSIVDLYSVGVSANNYYRSRQTMRGTISHETTLVRTGGASDGTITLSWKMVSSANAYFPNAPLLSDEIAVWSDSTGSSITVSLETLLDNATGLTDKDIYLLVCYAGSSSSPIGSRASGAASAMASASTWGSSSETWTTTGMSNPNKQKISVSFTPQMRGYHLITVALAKPSVTVYVDPKPTIS